MNSTRSDPVLDIEQPPRLVDYLRSSGLIGPHETPRVTVLTGGVSNRTVLVERSDSERWVVKQALPRLRVEVEWLADPARVHVEAAGMRWLAKEAPSGSIPHFVFEDRDQYLVVMEAVPEPHRNWKSMLLDGEVSEDHIEQFGYLLGRIHRRASESQAEVSQEFDDRSFFHSLRLEPYYTYTAGQVAESALFLNALVEDTWQRRLTLVHGDYSPKNILVHADRLILVDHEVVHFGDPAFDLGFSLTHLLSKAHHIPDLRTTFAAAAKYYWEVYAETLGDADLGDDLERFTVHHTLGCLLGRVAGRSKLEYLDEEERRCQQDAVIALMTAVPDTVDDLVGGFLERL